MSVVRDGEERVVEVELDGEVGCATSDTPQGPRPPLCVGLRSTNGCWSTNVLGLGVHPLDVLLELDASTRHWPRPPILIAASSPRRTSA